MKKKNKGFMIVETIVVGVFIMSMITFIYVNMRPLVGHFESQEKYNNPNSLYYADEIRMLFMHEIERTPLSLGLVKLHLWVRPFLFPGTSVCNKLFISSTNYCKALLNSGISDNPSLQVDFIYLTKYDISDLKAQIIKGNKVVESRALNDYLLYTKSNEGKGRITDFRIFVVFKDGTIGETEVRVYA